MLAYKSHKPTKSTFYNNWAVLLNAHWGKRKRLQCNHSEVHKTAVWPIRQKYGVASFVLKAMTEVFDVFISVCVCAAPCSLCLCSTCSLSAAQLWVSMVTGQLIRAVLCLSEAATGSCWAHDSAQAHPGLWPHLFTHAYTHWCMQKGSDTYVITLH